MDEKKGKSFILAVASSSYFYFAPGILGPFGPEWMDGMQNGFMSNGDTSEI